MVTGLLRCFNSSTICNFYPLCRWNNGLPSKIENAKELYPEMANILLGDANRVGRKERLTLANGILLNIPFEDSELESTFFENKSKFTLDIYSLFAKKEVRNAAFDDRENGYWQAFYIVEPVDPESVSLDKKIEIKLDGLTYIRPELSDLARGQFVVLKLIRTSFLKRRCLETTLCRPADIFGKQRHCRLLRRKTRCAGQSDL